MKSVTDENTNQKECYLYFIVCIFKGDVYFGENEWMKEKGVNPTLPASS